MGAECCDKDRGQMRREQVLTAAAACFQRHGFHGASMAQISREAGMSVGHIYHYFANKEAIIAAIVAGDQQQILAIDDEIRSHEDWARAMVEHVPRGLERAVEGPRGPLLLEVLATTCQRARRSARIAEAAG